MQLVKYHILKYSVDEDTQFIYSHIAQCQGRKKQWNDVKELHEREDTSSSMSYAEDKLDVKVWFYRGFVKRTKAH